MSTSDAPELIALVLSCTLKPSPAESNTEALARVVIDALEGKGVACETIRLIDLDIRPGVSSDEGDGDDWPQVLERVLASDILVLASPRPATTAAPSPTTASPASS
jgi:multimeric flavodoxin WrbA